MDIARLVLQGLALVSVTLTEASQTGSPDCPCIDPFPIYYGPYSFASNNDNTTLVNCTGFLYEGRCFPKSYGSSKCTSHDANHNFECQRSDPPTWCASNWCYISPQNCWKPHAPNSYTQGAYAGNPIIRNQSALDCPRAGWVGRCVNRDVEFAYSYETCGNLDAFTYESGYDMGASLPTGKVRSTL